MKLTPKKISNIFRENQIISDIKFLKKKINFYYY